MGLDMYLSAKRYIGGWDHKTDEERALFHRILKEVGGVAYDKASPSLEVEVTVGYWRKANAIHGWFVQTVQDGEDECRPHTVERSQLEELRRECALVLEHRAVGVAVPSGLLEPTGGFFFGGTDRDDYYFKDMEETIAIIDRCLAMPEQWDFTYCSSW